MVPNAMPSKAPCFLVTWRCTRRCVGSCLYCSYIPEYAKDTEVDTATGKKIVDNMHAFGAKWFGISGGEPLVRQDIFEIIDYAQTKYGMETSLITSGFAFDDKRLANLVKYKVHTAVSIDGNREANDSIRGKGAYDKAVYAMKRLSENDLLDCVVTTMTKYNIHDMIHPTEIAAEYKARMIVYHNTVPVGRAGTAPDLAPTADQYETAFNQIYDLQVKYMNKVKVNVYAPHYARIVRQRNPMDFWDWFENGFLGKCSIGGNYISVTENGDFRPCGFHEEMRIGNIAEKTLSQAWNELQNNELHLKLRDKSNLKGRCGVCEYREICGGCRTRAEYYTGDLFASDPACNYIPKVLREDPKLLDELRKDPLKIQ
jgi:radical SAM protein with 4Fe4S-binding SPASM domain